MQPNRWEFGLEKKKSFRIVKIMNNFCIFNNLPELLKKIYLIIVDNFFLCIFACCLCFSALSMSDWSLWFFTNFFECSDLKGGQASRVKKIISKSIIFPSLGHCDIETNPMIRPFHYPTNEFHLYAFATAIKKAN